MALSPEEQKIAEFGAKNGKSNVEVMKAIATYRANQVPQTSTQVNRPSTPGIAETTGSKLGSIGAGIGGFIDKAAGAVTNFIGAKPITETYGTEIAAIQNPNQASEIRQDAPSLKKVVGSAIETGSMLIPGGGVGASLVKKVALGGATGYGIDLGSKLQQDKTLTESATPGLGTATGALLPVVGKILGTLPKSMEEANLRMTPVEQQNLLKRGKDIASYLANKKIVGTPAQRYSKVTELYNKMEDRITKEIDVQGIVLPKDVIKEKVSSVIEKYKDDPIALPEVQKAIDEFLQFVNSKNKWALSLTELNKAKRSIMDRSFSKNKADVVSEGRYAVGTALKELLDENVPTLQKLNKEYADIIAARRVLFKATTRNQTGLLTRTLATGVGAAAGGTLGGFFGAAIGGVGAERLTNTLATPIRSGVGAGVKTLQDILSKIPVDAQGNIPAKLLIEALTNEE